MCHLHEFRWEIHCHLIIDLHLCIQSHFSHYFKTVLSLACWKFDKCCLSLDFFCICFVWGLLIFWIRRFMSFCQIWEAFKPFIYSRTFSSLSSSSYLLPGHQKYKYKLFVMVPEPISPNVYFFFGSYWVILHHLVHWLSPVYLSFCCWIYPWALYFSYCIFLS